MPNGWSISNPSDDEGWSVENPKTLAPPAIKPYRAPMKEAENGWIIDNARKAADLTQKAVGQFLRPPQGSVTSVAHGAATFTPANPNPKVEYAPHLKAQQGKAWNAPTAPPMVLPEPEINAMVPGKMAAQEFLNPSRPVVSAGPGGQVMDKPVPRKATPGEESVGQVLAGAALGAGSFVQNTATPENAAIGAGMLIPGVAPIAGLYFTYDMMKSAVEQAPEVKAKWDAGDKQGAAETAVQVLGSAYFAKKGAEHLANGARPVVEQMRQKPGMVPIAPPPPLETPVAKQSQSAPTMEAPDAAGWTIEPPPSNARPTRRGDQLGAVRLNPFGKPKPPVVEDYMNFDRLKITPEEKGRLQGEYEKFMGDNPQFRRSNAEVIDRAKELSPEQVDAAVRGDSASGNLQHDAAAYAVRQRINTLNSELYKMEGELQRQGLTMDDAAKSELESVIQSKNAELNEYMTKAEKSRSAAGRTLQMYNAMADNGFDFASWNGVAKRAMRLKPDQPLPPDVAKGIREAVGKGQEAEASGDPAQIKTAKVELATKVAKLHESSWWEMISALTKATILTGAKTHERNMIGNAVFAGMEEVSRIPAAITDIAVSTFNNRRTVSGASRRAVLAAGREASTRGVAEAKQVMMTGMSEADLVKGELPRELNFQGLGKASEVINVFTNPVFRALSAEDRLFKAYAIRRSIDAQANVMAINEARSGVISKAEIKSRAAELAQNPTEGMAVQSILDGDFATFNNRNNLAKAVDAGKISLERNAPPLKLAADLVVPFVRTPANITARLFDYSPAGVAWGTGKAITQTAVGKLKTRRVEKKGGTPAEIQKALDAEFTPKQQKAFSEAVGRGATGTAILLAGYWLGKKGLATGTDVAPIGERQADDYIGKQPGSAYLNGRWWRIDSFAPGGGLFAIGATLANEPNQWKKPVSFGSKVLATAGKTMLETPMLKGLKDVTESLAAPDQKGSRLVGSLTSRVIPTAVSDIASAMDPYKRDMTKNPIASRVPFLRNKLEPRLDAFGQPMENVRSNAFDPTLSKPDRRLTDPLAREMDRVGVSVAPMKPGDIYTVVHPDGRKAEYESKAEAMEVADDLELSGNKPKVIRTQETEERHRLRQEIVGPVMKQYMMETIASPEYQGMTDNGKKKALESAANEARAQMKDLIGDTAFVALPQPQQIEYLKTLRDKLKAQRQPKK